ncbi:MAG: ABC transporter permease [Clostridiales bacterium]|nr:ABC transporter permease [Clostridiales bacterium]
MKVRQLFKGKTREMILAAVIILMGAVVSVITPSFFTTLNITNILNGNAVIGIMSVGMMMVIVTGNIDVSVGPQFAIITMLTASYAKAEHGENVFVTVLLGILIGACLGLFNGLVVAKLNIPAIVVTLGTMNIMRGTLYLVTKGHWVEGLTGPFAKFANARYMGLPRSVIIWFLVLLFTYFILYHTRIGRDILAVGGNKIAAGRIGISRTRAYLCAFGYLGALTGLAAVLSASRLKIAQPSNGIGYEMQLIAATVIGGTVFAGGVASILGTFLGVLLLGIINNGLVLSKIPIYWQDLATGLILIIAVASSAFQSKKSIKIRKGGDAK